jgi:hypothetical protein
VPQSLPVIGRFGKRHERKARKVVSAAGWRAGRDGCAMSVPAPCFGWWLDRKGAFAPITQPMKSLGSE